MRHPGLVGIAGLCGLAANSLAAIAQTGGDNITNFGIAFKPRLELSRNVRSADITKPFPQDNPRYYRLRIQIENPDAAQWSFIVRSPAGQVLSVFDQNEKTCEDKTGCWTTRLSSQLPTVQLSTESSTLRLKVLDGLYMPQRAPSPFYSPIQGSTIEDLTGMSFASRDAKMRMFNLADSVGMFISSGPTTAGETANWCCSGLRLTTDLFMTNWHCGASKNMKDTAFWKAGADSPTCQSAIVDMSWDVDNIAREYSCESVQFASKELDVAILRLGTLADGPELTRPVQTPLLAASAATTGQDITILHHPACLPKSVTRGCSVLQTDIAQWGSNGSPLTEFSHGCTTEQGSSGAPVFSDGKVIGLHHLGIDANRGPGNFAVSMPAILDAIKRDAPSLYGEISDQIR